MGQYSLSSKHMTEHNVLKARKAVLTMKHIGTCQGAISLLLHTFSHRDMFCTDSPVRVCELVFMWQLTKYSELDRSFYGELCKRILMLYQNGATLYNVSMVVMTVHQLRHGVWPGNFVFYDRLPFTLPCQPCWYTQFKNPVCSLSQTVSFENV